MQWNPCPSSRGIDARDHVEHAPKCRSRSAWAKSRVSVGPGKRLAAFGLWPDNGGWPSDAPLHQNAFEPTTALRDDLDSAKILGQMRLLERGSAHNLAVQITLTNQP